MRPEQAQKMLNDVEDMLDNPVTAARLSFQSHHRLEKIRSFLRAWISNGDQISDAQREQMMFELVETLMQAEEALSRSVLN